MSREISCPTCTKPVPALDMPATCPHCGGSVPAVGNEQIQPGVPEAIPHQTHGVQRQLPRRSPRFTADWDTDDGLNIRVPPQPVALRTRTTIAVVLVSLVIVADLALGCLECFRLTIVERVAQVPLVAGVRVLPPDLHQQLDMADNLCFFAAAARNVLFVISVITFLMWVYRAYATLTELRAGGLNHTPGWAVGVYFIPFLNLVRGCTVMQEIWKGSDPDRVATESQWKAGSAGAVVVWWLLYLATAVINSFGRNLINLGIATGSLDAFAIGEKCNIAAAVLSILNGLLLIRLLIRVTARQEQRFAVLHQLPE